MKNDKISLEFRYAVMKDWRKIDPIKINCRRALVSGLNVALVMAIQYAEAGFPKLSAEFRNLVYQKKEVPILFIEYIGMLRRASGGSIDLLTTDFQNIGLRLGEPGKYYAAGIATGVLFGMELMPKKYNDAMEWIEIQTDWLNTLNF